MFALTVKGMANVPALVLGLSGDRPATVCYDAADAAVVAIRRSGQLALTADLTALAEREQHEQAEALVAATGADFRIGGARAFYDIGGDYVQVPPQPAITHQIDFYRTALHKLGHWAGTRCGWRAISRSNG